jgi:hypothetical protein
MEHIYVLGQVFIHLWTVYLLVPVNWIYRILVIGTAITKFFIIPKSLCLFNWHVYKLSRTSMSRFDIRSSCFYISSLAWYSFLHTELIAGAAVHCTPINFNVKKVNFHSFTARLDTVTSFIYPTECTTRLF